ncbi:hypothetical protein GH5_07216 [Leishmania sp. Ghana 2012 LV757]|uniref:hypothetical protein n=1 Tax=Leishmania sp. Ghana 2012 LV757 TaxID=2803181 RepID=UPI001B3F95F3|nr:hypothetical protein GH5_07216 [Leishmania sp. Ghana 2012 LV757]
MVRVGAKRERPCMVVLHVALRAAALPSTEGLRQGDEWGSPSVSPRERFLWKTSATAEVYAKAVIRSVHAYWHLLGGVRYAIPDALTLVSAVWQDVNIATLAAKTAAPEGGSAEGASSLAYPSASTTMPGILCSKQKHRQRGSTTQRRSGVLRCAVRLSRSVYGDAGAVHILRAACACVTQTTVAVPLSQMIADDGAATAVTDASKNSPQRTRRGRAEEDVGDFMEQTCHAAVRVARVEHVLLSR